MPNRYVHRRNNPAQDGRYTDAQGDAHRQKAWIFELLCLVRYSFNSCRTLFASIWYCQGFPATLLNCSPFTPSSNGTLTTKISNRTTRSAGSVPAPGVLEGDGGPTPFALPAPTDDCIPMSFETDARCFVGELVAFVAAKNEGAPSESVRCRFTRLLLGDEEP